MKRFIKTTRPAKCGVELLWVIRSDDNQRANHSRLLQEIKNSVYRTTIQIIKNQSSRAKKSTHLRDQPLTIVAWLVPQGEPTSQVSDVSGNVALTSAGGSMQKNNPIVSFLIVGLYVGVETLRKDGRSMRQKRIRPYCEYIVVDTNNLNPRVSQIVRPRKDMASSRDPPQYQGPRVFAFPSTVS